MNLLLLDKRYKSSKCDPAELYTDDEKWNPQKRLLDYEWCKIYIKCLHNVCKMFEQCLQNMVQNDDARSAWIMFRLTSPLAMSMLYRFIPLRNRSASRRWTSKGRNIVLPP